MSLNQDSVSMAIYCDFENVALGVRDAKYQKFDIRLVLERLLLKGSIVVKKAYCDWDRYKDFKAAMHEANFELIEIPHVRQSGKNSADIRLVVDALDFCYTKSHVDTFVIISGDSDFSPLVSKLRENAKQVIGVGVKQSTSDLLIANCDEFIFYDDLVRDRQRTESRSAPPAQQPRRTPAEEKRRKEEIDARRDRAIHMVAETFEALISDRGDGGKIWASVLKEALKRRRPDFSESYYGFKTFGNLLEEAQARGLLEFGRDEKSGAYVYRSTPGQPAAEPVARPQEGRGRRGGRKTASSVLPEAQEPQDMSAESPEPELGLESAVEAAPEPAPPPAPARRRSRTRKAESAEPAAATPAPMPEDTPATAAPEPEPAPAAEAQPEAAPAKPRRAPRKTAARTRRTRTTDAES